MIKRSECKCGCHSVPGMMHVMPCCEPDHVAGSLREAKLPERGIMIRYQQVFDELHKDAAARLPPGTRYEIRLMGRPPFRRITVHSTKAMNQIEPWTNAPEQTDEYYRVSRCTTPKEP